MAKGLNTSITIFLAGALSGAAAFSFFFRPDMEVSRTETLTERVEIKVKDTTIYHFKDSLVLKVRHVSASPEPTVGDSLRTYAGRENFDFGILEWKAETIGKLQAVQFAPTMFIPEKTVVKTSTESRYINQKSLFLGASINSDLAAGASVSYLNRNALATYSYYPISRQHSINFSLKMF